MIEVAEIIIYEADEQNFAADLFNADLLVGEDGAWIVLHAVVTDAAGTPLLGTAGAFMLHRRTLDIGERTVNTAIALPGF